MPITASYCSSSRRSLGKYCIADRSAMHRLTGILSVNAAVAQVL
jgi:hypothetical protein